MKPNRHQRLKALFVEACELEDEAQRTFVDRVCGDDNSLRKELLELLEFHSADTVRSGGADAMVGSGREDPSSPKAGSRNLDRFETGEVFVGRYRMLGRLGHGGMGEVYKAHDLILDQTVALKFLYHIDLPLPRAGGSLLQASGSKQLERLLNEVRLARQVTHPHVCRVFDFGQADNELYLTMEYIDGENLASLLGRIGHFPQDRLTDLMLQLCDGLEAAHSQGILHRDLKPANIMIDGQGRIRITDFGLATHRLDGGKGHGFAGTPAYMAPEQLHGDPATVQSDLYALGLILYEMATGRPAFPAKSLAEFAAHHQNHQLTPPSAHVSHFDPMVETIILRCLEKDPARRPHSAAQIAGALPSGVRLQRALAAGETPSPELVAQAGTRRAVPLGQTAWWLAGLLLGLFILAGFADIAYPGRQAWTPLPPAALTAKAQEILKQLGHDAHNEHQSWGFIYEPAGHYGEAPGLFWHRQASTRMVPRTVELTVSDARITFDDPPSLEEGMARVLLTADGRLVYLDIVAPDPMDFAVGDDLEETLSENAIPPETGTVSEAATPSEIEGAPPGVPQVAGSLVALQMAGFDLAALQPSNRVFKPPVHGDQVMAWQTTDGAFEILAASFQGQLVYFDVLSTAAFDPEMAFLDQLLEIYFLVQEILWIGLFAMALVLAYRNWTKGRGDTLGAQRLAIFVFAIGVLRWIVLAQHAPNLAEEMARFMPAVGVAGLEAVGAWLAYIGLEPMVRRFWPQTLISWNRLLRRQFNDPLVGRSVLIGAFFGVLWAILVAVDRILAQQLKLDKAVEMYDLWQLENAAGLQMLIANLFSSLSEAILWGMLALLALVGLRFTLKRLWPAVTAFILLHGLIETLQGFHPAVSWLTFGLGVSSLTAWLLVRWGLLSHIVALATMYFLTTSAVSLETQLWYGESGVLAAAIVAALGLAAFRAANAPTPALEFEASPTPFS